MSGPCTLKVRNYKLIHDGSSREILRLSLSILIYIDNTSSKIILFRVKYFTIDTIFIGFKDVRKLIFYVQVKHIVFIINKSDVVFNQFVLTQYYSKKKKYILSPLHLYLKFIFYTFWLNELLVFTFFVYSFLA